LAIEGEESAHLLVTVDGERGPAIRSQVLGELIGDSLGADEDDNLAVLLRDSFEVLEELATLVKLGADFDVLSDVVVRRQVKGSDVDLDEVVLEVHSETLNLLGPSSREQERLTVRSDLSDNLPDLGLETHVQHAVGFVHDEVGDTSEVGLASLQHINQTTGGGNADLDTALQVSDLRTLGGTTVDGSVSDAGRFTELGALGLGLDSKLTSWGKDEDDWSIAWGEKRLGVDVNHSGKGERDGFTGTGLSDGDDITTRQSHRPSLALDTGGAGEAESANLAQDVLGEASLFEGRDRTGDVLTLDLLVSCELQSVPDGLTVIFFSARKSAISFSERAVTRGSST